MNFKFFSRDLSTVEQRASEQRLAVEQLLTRQAEAALDAVLSGNYSLCDQIAVQLRTANEKLKVLQLAEQAVRDKEAEAEREAKAKEGASRRRALSQHLARLQRSAAEYEHATSTAVAAFQAMVEAGQSALQQVGGRIEMYNELSEGKLRVACEREIRRVGSKATHLGDMPWAPGSSNASIGGTPIQQLEPLSKAIARISKWTTERFQVTSSKAPVKANRATAEAETPLVAGMEPKATDTPSHTTQSVPREPSSLASDPAEAKAFRTLERLKNPHVEGSEEAAGFEQALREMNRSTNRKGDSE